MALQFFLFALLLVSAQTQAKSVDVPSQRDINDIINQVLERFVAAVKELINEAKNILQTLYDSLAAEAQEELDKALAELKLKVAEFQKEIEALEEQAAQLGEAARECVKNEEGNIQELQNSTRDNLVACHKNLLDKARKVLEETKGKIQASANLVFGLVDKLQNCGSNVFCYMELIGEVPKAIEEVKGNIAEIVAGFQNFKDNEVQVYGKCVNNVLTSYASQSQAINESIQTCMNNIGSL